MWHVGNQCRATIVGRIVKNDESVGTMIHNHCRNGAEPLILGVFIYGDGPERAIVERRIRRFPSGQLIACHGMRAHIAMFQSNGFNLFPNHCFDTADIGERGDVRIDQWLQRTQDLRHGLERIA